MNASDWLTSNVAVFGLLVGAAVIPNGVWRWLAVLAAARFDDSSPIFAWVRHVATCLVAGVVAQMMILPPGALAAAPPWLRWAALCLAGLAWLLARRNVFVAWIAGVCALMAGTALL
ncbi:MAG: AzlD domain-containing protein [Beijerinckiaceae bacterium]